MSDRVQRARLRAAQLVLSVGGSDPHAELEHLLRQLGLMPDQEPGRMLRAMEIVNTAYDSRQPGVIKSYGG